MGRIDRRGFVVSLVNAGAAVAIDAAMAQNAAPQQPPRFGYAEVVARARGLATAPMTPAKPLPEPLARLDPSVASDIKFRPEKDFLASTGTRFRLEPIHLDPKSARSVTVNLIRDGIATPIPYSANLFDFGRAKFERPLPLNLGFAGFHLKFPMNQPASADDALVFTAASQFEFLGRGQRMGAMLRALSVNAGEANEEFPFFREFWVQIPGPNAARATVFALLDGESVTGAFSFQIAPGADSTLDVVATLFPRRIGGKFGLAPIVSMYLRDAGETAMDFPPAAHSSDGLALRNGAGEWLWRPLRNPSEAERFEFLDRAPRGFGLAQRGRAFARYQDLEQAFEARPSYWIEPVGDWGEGHVELREQPAADINASNISAAWVANAQLEPDKPLNYAYRVFASVAPTPAPPLGRVVDTFVSRPTDAGVNGKRLRVDFSGGDLAYFLGDPSRVEVLATANNGRVVAATAAPNPHVKGFRATVDIEAAPGEAADVRVSLRAAGRTLTEVWTMPVEG